MIGYYNELSVRVAVEGRQAELLACAEDIRRAHVVQGPRPLRRQIGRLLIAAGHALAFIPRDKADEFERRHAHA